VTDRELLFNIVHQLDAGGDWLDGDKYLTYYWLGRMFRPKIIVEFGVRFGYSLYALWLGSQAELLVGYDNEHDHPGSSDYALKMFKKIKGPDVSLRNQDTQQLQALPYRNVDLVHVDAWHTVDGVIHECRLAKGCLSPGGIILVDDVTGNESVRSGANEFCQLWGVTPVLVPTVSGLYIIPTAVGK